jgi:UDP-glucose 4-epimerase
MSVCLVTGGAGFIGSHLVEALVEQGHEVRVLDDLSAGSLDNLQEVRGKVQFLHGDVTDRQAVRAAVDGVELVFHQAALSSIPRSLIDPLAVHHACATGTLLLLLAAREAGVRRVIYAGSSSAYGNSDMRPRSELDPTRPMSPYAVAKLAGEQYCATFTHVCGLETVRLRYFHVYGPRQAPDSPYATVVPLFLEALLDGRSPVIHGDGLQSRDFTYVGDVVQANLLAARGSRVAGKAYNIAFGRRTTLLELLRHANELLGTNVTPIHAPPRAGDVRHSLADTSLVQAELGFCPCTDVRRGLELCLPWYVERRLKRRAGAQASVPLSGPHRHGVRNGSISMSLEN